MASIEVKQTAELERIFDRMSEVQRGVRSGLVKASKLVVSEAKRRVPTGDPKHNPQAKPLRDTIGYIIRKYDGGSRQVAVIGPQYPAGAHGHLVEEGHKVYRRGPAGESYRGRNETPLTGKSRTEAKPFLAPAGDTTKGRQEMIVEKAVSQIIIELGG
jgi:hypothetical protein